MKERAEEPLDLTLNHPPPLDYSLPLPPYISYEVEKVMARREWKNMPSFGSALYVKLTDSPVLEGKVFNPRSWIRQNDTEIDLESSETRHTSDKRRFSAAIVSVDNDFDPERLDLLLQRVVPRLRLKKGNSEKKEELEFMPQGPEKDKAIEATIAKSAPVFILAPAGNKERLEDFLKSQEELFAVNAVNKSNNKGKFTVGEARIQKKSDMPHRDLRAGSAQKDYDYLTIGLEKMVKRFKKLDPRIKTIHLGSEHLGERSADKRLRHSNNYLRDIKSALEGVGVEFEYSCGCRFVRYREKGNIYNHKLGACPSGIEIETEELPNMEMLDEFSDEGSSNAAFERLFRDSSNEAKAYEKREITPKQTLISNETTKYLCPDGCGQNTVSFVFAGRTHNGFSVVNSLHCPATKKRIIRTIETITTDEFLARYDKKS